VKQRTRTVAAVVTTSLLAGGGLAATVTGLTQPAPQVMKSDAGKPGVEASQQAALAAALDELVSRNREVHRQVTSARRQLRRVDLRLSHERKVVERLAVTRSGTQALPAVPAATPPRSASRAPAPVTHSTTRASGSGRSMYASETTPRVHATTRASGAAHHAGAHAARPKVHTTTRASGSKAVNHHEREHDDD
jgi:hypothetical protein